MKTQIIKYTLGLVISIIGFSSCTKSFLEVDPKGKLIAKNIGDYDLLFNNITQASLSPSIDAQIIMGDEVTSIDPYYTVGGVRELRLFRWDDVIYEPNEDAVEMSALMKLVYTYNKIITEVPNAKGGTDEQKMRLIAEAMLNRAWIYFYLNNYYGKPYNSLTAATDLSYPIITAADVTETSFKRATVQEGYDFMISDLQTAIANLPIDAAGRTRGTKSAAEGLLGKVYVFMGKYNEGLQQLNNALDHLPSSFKVRLYDYNVTMTENGPWGYNSAVSPLSFVSGTPLLPDNEESLLGRQITNSYGFLSPFALLTSKAAELFTPSDQRKKFFTSRPYGGAVFPVAGVLRRNGPIAVQCGLTLPEVYLLRAECKARTNDVGGARIDLETLRKNRMSTTEANVSVTDPTVMIKTIIDERIREFALQGYRWFDMRRLSVDPIFAGTTYTHSYINAAGVATVFNLRPDRFVMRFTDKVMLANAGMKNNP